MRNGETAPNTAGGWRLESSYAELPALFYAEVAPTPTRGPELTLFNRALAERLGLDPDALDSEAGARIFAGNELPPGSRPLAQAYAGHQFGHFTTLGDGRAILLGEQIAPDGARFDIQLKGPGLTPYSRNGDGRAALGPMLREHIISEAMAALGIPTTRSLAVAATGEVVYRESELPGAVLTRVAASHLRVGTFQWAAANGDPAALRDLADYALRRHFPEALDAEQPYLALLHEVMERQASLIAHWLRVGFIHGVMNTDNMAISGETIDYGPCAFMDTYDPATVFSSIDRRGRYAYGNQPTIALWNLARFAESLLPLLHPNQATGLEAANAALEGFEGRFQRHWQAAQRSKLGLFGSEEGDPELSHRLLAWMVRSQADYTNTFRQLSDEAAQAQPPFDDADFRAWHADWARRLARQPQSPTEVAARMRSANPAIIPRNHRVEEALAAAVNNQDLAPLRQLLAALERPYDYAAAPPEYAAPPEPSSRIYQTFCGT